MNAVSSKKNLKKTTNIRNMLVDFVCFVFEHEKLLSLDKKSILSQQLKRDYNLFHAIIEHSFGAILVTDIKGNIIYVNSALEIALSINSESLLGNNFYNLFDTRIFSTDVIGETISYQNEFKRFGVEILSPDIPFSYVRVYTRVFRDAKNNPAGIFSFWVDEEDTAAQLMREITTICIKSTPGVPDIGLKCANAVSHEDWYVRSHSRNVTKYSCLIAKAINMDALSLKTVISAALLHDIGKRDIPAEILNKTGKLTRAEFNIIKQHPITGYNIVKKVPSMARVAEAILYHHEWFNGGGYPYGLRGKSIPLESRIVCVADAFDAMISNRPYKRRRGVIDALIEIKKCSGTQFDPELAKVCKKIFINTI